MLNSSSEVIKTQRWRQRGAREQMWLLRHLLLSVKGPQKPLFLSEETTETEQVPRQWVGYSGRLTHGDLRC